MALVVKNLPANAGDIRVLGSILSREDPQENAMAHSNILAWRIPETEDPGWLQSIGSKRVGNNWSNLALKEKGESGGVLS